MTNKITINKDLLQQAIEAMKKSVAFCNRIGVDDWQPTALACHSGIAALRAALAEPAGWRPIETAPRYGRLLVTGTEIGTCVASAGWDTETPESIKWGVVNEIYVTPTHWMSLPPVSGATSPQPPANVPMLSPSEHEAIVAESEKAYQSDPNGSWRTALMFATEAAVRQKAGLK